MKGMTENEFLISVAIAVIAILILTSINIVRNRKKNVIPSAKSDSVEKTPNVERKIQWFERLKLGMEKTRHQMISNIDSLFTSQKEKLKQDELFENLFEILIRADVGFQMSKTLVDNVRKKLLNSDSFDSEKIKVALREEILLVFQRLEKKTTKFLDETKSQSELERIPHIILLVGVNGAGKTTTLGKLAFKANLKGEKVLIGAADTFRAAAAEQLEVWAQRSQAEIVKLKEGTDPASVAFETVKKARHGQFDLCLIDTAGRLQTRNDLMQELAKIQRVIAKEFPQGPHEVLLVLDATTGQNALQQAQLFKAAVNVTGVVLTKLDGTAKGGVVMGIVEETGIPIRYVGVGESVEDLEVFEPQEFVNAIFED